MQPQAYPAMDILNWLRGFGGTCHQCPNEGIVMLVVDGKTSRDQRMGPGGSSLINSVDNPIKHAGEFRASQNMEANKEAATALS